MPRALLILALLVASMATSLPAFAQSPPEKSPPAISAPSEPAPTETTTAPSSIMTTAEQSGETLGQRLEGWSRVLDGVGEQLKAEDLSLALLDELDTKVKQVGDQLDAPRVPLQREVARIDALIAALGPPPKEGEPPELADVAAQRGGLNQQLNVPAGQLAELKLLVRRASLLLSDIARAKVRVREKQLLSRTPSLVSSETWARAASEFVPLAKRILVSPIEWYESPEISGTIGNAYLAGVFLAIFGAAVLGWHLRRGLIRNYGRKPAVEKPSFRMRAIAVLAEGTAHTTIPILGAAVAYGALLSSGLLTGVFQHLVLGTIVAVAVFSLVNGLPRAVLAPKMPHWRLTHMGDRAARRWCRRTLTIAMIVSIDALIVFPFDVLEPSMFLRFTYRFVADGAMAAAFLAVVLDKRLWLTPEEEARVVAIKAGESPGPPVDDSARRSRWWFVGRVVVGAVALAIPILSLARYGVLSDFIARRLLVSAGVFLVALVLRGLARDFITVFTHEDEKPPGHGETVNPIYLWSMLLLDIGSVATIVLFLVPIWGGHWHNILERISWAMSEVTIGGRTFSLTDVLIGMVVFAILFILVRFIQRFLDMRVLRQTRMDVGVRTALKAGIGYVGVVIAALIAIHTAGIDLSGLAIVAGALSVGIGFGMQSIVSNFVSGLILLIERPIKEGDWIVVGQDEGYVKRISVRSTEIQTFSNATVIVPNSELITGSVTNWMYKDKSGRAELPIGVAYGSDTAKVREVLLDCLKGHNGIRAWPQPTVLFMDFGDNALLFQLRFYVNKVDDRLSIASDIRFAIDAAFREAGISIPFPQRDVHVIEASAQPDETEVKPDKAATPQSSKVLPIRSGRRADDSGIDQDSDD